MSEWRIDLGLPRYRTTCSCVRERTHWTLEVSLFSVPSPGLTLCRGRWWVGRENPVPPPQPANEDSRVVVIAGGFCVGRRQGKWAQLLLVTAFLLVFLHLLSVLVSLGLRLRRPLLEAHLM